ncbi:hypothetical protein ABIC88_000805 [Pseudomonas kilonensis]
MTAYYLYGIKGVTIFEAKLGIEKDLMFSFEEREHVSGGRVLSF